MTAQGGIKRRGATPQVRKQVEHLVNNHERHLHDYHGDAAGLVISPGCGSAAGFPGVPVIKVASNPGKFNSMVGDIDVNAGSIYG